MSHSTRQKILRIAVQALAKFPSKRPAKNPCAPKATQLSFLIPAYTGLGNFILKTPLICQLKSEYPDARIDILAGNRFGTEYVLADSPWINEVKTFPIGASKKEWIRFFLHLRGSYSHVFLFFDTAHVWPLYWGSVLAGIPNRIGHVDPKAPLPPWLEESLTQRVKLREDISEVDLNLDLFEVLKPGFKRYYDQTVAVAHEYSEPLETLLQTYLEGKSKPIVLQVTAANGAKTPKIWPAEYFQRLIELLLKKALPVVALGDQSEVHIVSDILKPFGGRVLNLAGKTTVGEAAKVIQSAKVLVCHDSGLMHIGNALKTPLIALYGPSDYERTRPLSTTSRVLRMNYDCMPCFKLRGWSEEEALEKCPFQIRCMRDLNPQTVFDNVIELLK